MLCRRWKFHHVRHCGTGRSIPVEDNRAVGRQLIYRTRPLMMAVQYLISNFFQERNNFVTQLRSPVRAKERCVSTALKNSWPIPTNEETCVKRHSLVKLLALGCAVLPVLQADDHDNTAGTGRVRDDEFGRPNQIAIMGASRRDSTADRQGLRPAAVAAAGPSIRLARKDR